MKRLLHLLELVTLLVVAVAYCKPAHAYVDMGTGSYIIQISIAAAAGAIFSLKMFWNTLRTRFAKLFSRNRDAAPVQQPGQPSGNNAR